MELHIENGVLLGVSAHDGHVTLPPEVVEIGAEVFLNDRELLTLTATNDLMYRIGRRAFAGCTRLRSVTLPGWIHCIEKEAFADCKFLKEFPRYLSDYLGPGAFRGCLSLTEANLPNGLTALEADTFRGCRKLAQVHIPFGAIQIGDRCFRDSAIDTLQTESSMLRIGHEAFAGCTSLRRVKLIYGLKELGADAFRGCTALTTVTLPGSVEIMGSNAFYGCTALKEVRIPRSAPVCKTLTGSEPFPVTIL